MTVVEVGGFFVKKIMGPSKGVVHRSSLTIVRGIAGVLTLFRHTLPLLNMPVLQKPFDNPKNDAGKPIRYSPDVCNVEIDNTEMSRQTKYQQW